MWFLYVANCENILCPAVRGRACSATVPGHEHPLDHV